MESPDHNLEELFSQLGLENQQADIEAFISQHSPLKLNCLLHQADFWNTSQANFLKEAVEDDADWVDAVNHLDTLLRGKPKL